jgi:ABC-type branched-subunit amino acid transport system substrate-binding protein
LKNEDFGAMIVSAPMVESARIIRDTLGLGIKTYFIGGDSWGYPSQRFFSVLGNLAWDGRAIFFWHEDMPIPALHQYLTQFKEVFNYTSTTSLLLTYDSMMMIIDALIKHNGNLTRDDLEKHLQNLGAYQGIAGTYHLNNKSYGRKTAVVVKNQGQKFVIDEIIPPE